MVNTVSVASSGKRSICNLFESIPQREFVETGYDPMTINQSGKNLPVPEITSTNPKRPSLTSMYTSSNKSGIDEAEINRKFGFAV